MKLTELFLDQLKTEAAASRKAVERVPDGREGWKSWKPHPKSMEMGYLATLVATMPAWIDMIIRRDELDVAPKEPGGFKNPDLSSASELAGACDAAEAKAREALGGTDDAFLMTKWEAPRGRTSRRRACPLSRGPRRLHAHGAPPRPADRVPAFERRESTVDLRPLGGREDVRVRSRRLRMDSVPGSPHGRLSSAPVRWR